MSDTCSQCKQYLVDRSNNEKPNADQYFNLIYNKNLDSLDDETIDRKIEFINKGLKICQECQKKTNKSAQDQATNENFKIYEMQDMYIRNALDRHRNEGIAKKLKFPKVPTAPLPSSSKKSTTAVLPEEKLVYTCTDCERFINNKTFHRENLDKTGRAELLRLRKELMDTRTKCIKCKNDCIKQNSICDKFDNIIKLYNIYLVNIEVALAKK
jgi:hypothetical protein